MAFVMLWEMSIQILGADQLQHGVAKKLQPLIGAQREIREADAAICERTSQQTNVMELHADGIFKFCEMFQHAVRFYPLAITQWLLLLQRMRRIIDPDL